MGIALGKWPFPKPPLWSLVCLEGVFEDQEIKGQFPPEAFTENVSTSWSDLAIAKRREPILQWSRGEAETASFSAKLWAERLSDDILSQVTMIRATVEPDADLGRPPLWRFAWGPIEFDCVVVEVGGIVYDGLWSDGRIKGVTFALRLRKVVDKLSLEPIDPAAPVHDSLYSPVVAGETFESMAGRQYGEPMIGVLLRQRSKVAFPRPGEIVRLPEAGRFAGKPYKPLAYALGDSPAAVAVRSARLDEAARDAEVPLVRADQ